MSERVQRETLWEASPATHTDETLGLDRNGFYWAIPGIKRIQLSMGDNLQDDQHGASDPGSHKNESI
jgi:hypothetical protein